MLSSSRRCSPTQPLGGLSPTAVKPMHAPQDSGLLGSPGVFSGVPGSLRLVGPSSGLGSRLTPALPDLRLWPGQLHTGGSQGISARDRLLWVLSRPCVPPCPRQGPTEVKEDFKMSPEKINLPQSRLPYPLGPPQNNSCSFHPPTSPGSACRNAKRRMTYLLARDYLKKISSLYDLVRRGYHQLPFWQSSWSQQTLIRKKS